MKNTIVVVFLFLTTLVFSDWQQKEKVALPKGIQINDLTVDETGAVWIISSSSILKLDPGTKNPILISEFKDGKTMAVLGPQIYVVDIQNRLAFFNPEQENSVIDLNLTLTPPVQLNALQVEKNPVLAVLEQKKLRFVNQEKLSFYLNADIDRFAAIPNADYADAKVPFFTLSQERVYAWLGGNYRAPEKYQSRLLYSSSGDIFDLAADPDGNLFILFADSVVVLDNSGEYRQKIGIERMSSGSRVFSDPQNDNLILYNPVERNFRVLSESRKESGEAVVLNKNLPNPVDNYTEIEFTLAQSLDLTLTIYNLIGEPVKVVTRGYFSKGTHRSIWHADDERGNLVPNGVYFYRLESKKGFAIRQLIVLR
jgi:hypothetical protein